MQIMVNIHKIWRYPGIPPFSDKPMLLFHPQVGLEGSTSTHIDPGHLAVHSHDHQGTSLGFSSVVPTSAGQE
jgi:hypothetical protein